MAMGLCWAQDLPSYDIQRTAETIAIDGKLDEAVWKKAKPVGDFHFNWWTSGEKEKTVARVLWSGRRCVRRNGRSVLSPLG